MFVNPGSHVGKGEGGVRGTCLLEAIVALLPEGMKREAMKAMLPVTLAGAQTNLKSLRPRLAPLGVSFKHVSSRYLRDGGAPLHLFRETACKLLIYLHLDDIKGRLCKHAVAFDGRVVHDQPLSAQVNLTWDRATTTSCNNVFKKLFPESEFRRCHIVNVFELRLII